MGLLRDSVTCHKWWKRYSFIFTRNRECLLKGLIIFKHTPSLCKTAHQCHGSPSKRMLCIFSEIPCARYIECAVSYSLLSIIKYQDMRGEKNLCVSQLYSFGENTLKYIRSKYVKSLATSVSTSGIKLERIEITHCVEISTQKRDNSIISA